MINVSGLSWDRASGLASVATPHVSSAVILKIMNFAVKFFSQVEKILSPPSDCAHCVCVHVGLPSHPQHELMKRQCTGCPGMITFYIKGKLEHASTFLSNLKVMCRSPTRQYHSTTVYTTVILLMFLLFHTCSTSSPLLSSYFRCLQ